MSPAPSRASQTPTDGGLHLATAETWDYWVDVLTKFESAAIERYEDLVQGQTTCKEALRNNMIWCTTANLLLIDHHVRFLLNPHEPTIFVDHWPAKIEARAKMYPGINFWPAPKRVKDPFQLEHENAIRAKFSAPLKKKLGNAARKVDAPEAEEADVDPADVGIDLKQITPKQRRALRAVAADFVRVNAQHKNAQQKKKKKKKKRPKKPKPQEQPPEDDPQEAAQDGGG